MTNSKRMLSWIALLALCVFTPATDALAAGKTTQVNFQLQTTDADGAPITQNRTYYVYRPTGLSTSSPVPMVLLMAAGPGGADSALNATADRAGFVVVTGSFSGNSTGTPGTVWVNDNPLVVGPEDYDYVDEVIRRVKASDNSNDVFIVGLSKGGHAAYAYACERPGMIRAAASLDEFMNLTQNIPSAPVPIIAFQGTADVNVPYVMQKDSVDAWRRTNGLLDVVPVTTYESSPLIPGSVTQATWRGGIAGTQVAFVTIVGGTHVYPKPTIQTGYDFGQGLWAFFSQFLTSTQAGPKIVSSPVDQVQVSGIPASFWVSAIGEPPLQYQWQRSTDGGATFVDIPGETDTWFTTRPTSPSDDGTRYRAVVTNASGSASSGTATLTVSSSAGPEILTRPADLTALAGDPVQFSVEASGSPTIQWQKNGMDLLGATDAIWSGVALSSDSGAAFRARVSDGSGTSVTAVGTLTVKPAPGAPVIRVNPARLRVVVGGTGAFGVEASSATPMRYQWQRGDAFGKNLVDIPGATGATWTIPPATLADNHTLYRCVISNDAGATASASEMLQVSNAPTAPREIMSLPFGSGVVGNPFSYTIVQSGGTVPLTFDASPLPPGLALDPISGVISGTPTAAGTTELVVAAGNAAGRCARKVTLTFAEEAALAPTITRQPIDQIVMVGEPATFTVEATASPSPSYQWQRDGVDIPGAIAASYTTPPTRPDDDGASYRVAVRNSAGATLSESGRLSVLSSAVAPGAESGCGCGAGAGFGQLAWIVLLTGAGIQRRAKR